MPSSEREESDSTSSPSPSDCGTADEMFHQLIETAPAEDLRLALQRTTRTFSDTDQVNKLLSGLRHRRAEEESHPRGSRKRSHSETPEVCAGCEKEYDEAENVPGCCRFYRYHPGKTFCDDERRRVCSCDVLGEPEADGDANHWTDMDEWFPRDFEDNRAGYIFSCCEEDGNSEGCARYVHVSAEMARVSKRHRSY